VNANVTCQWDDEGNQFTTPLHFAVSQGHVDPVRNLLAHKPLDVKAELHCKLLQKVT
jgi:hypothetical protein